MKKIISWLVIAAFLAAGFSLVAAARADNNGPELEKILSPEMIGQFRAVKKVGKALYGLRITLSGMPPHATSTPGAIGTLITTNLPLQRAAIDALPPLGRGTATATASKLEKISAPAFINLYTKIKQIGTALWGVKKDDNSATSQQPVSPGSDQTEGGTSTSTDAHPFVIITPDIAACVATAINIKDQAVIAEVNAAATGLTSAITARSTCQQAAIQSTSNQQAAVAACAQGFQTARQQINQIAQQAQKDAWTTYSSSLRVCRADSVVSTSTPTVSASSTGEIMIEDGGGNFVNTVINNGSGD